MSWLKKLIGRFTKRHSDRVVPGPSVNREIQAERGTLCDTARGDALPACPRCGVVPINSDVHNTLCLFVSETRSNETVLVGAATGIVRVPLDRAIHPRPDLLEAIRLAAERTSGNTSQEKLGIQAAAEIRCINCDSTRMQLAARGSAGPCCREPFWTVPYELMWRSLPGGEDR
jgi:hypothetical protein